MLGTLAIEERSRSNVTCVLVILCYLTFSIYPQVSGPDDLDEETSLSSTCCAATAETTARLKTYSGKMVPKLLSMCVRCQISKDCYCTLIQFNATLRLSRASRAPRPDCFPKVQSIAGGHQHNPQKPSWGFDQPWPWKTTGASLACVLAVWPQQHSFWSEKGATKYPNNILFLSFFNLSSQTNQNSQVQQRGVDGTKTILEELLSEVDKVPRQPVLVVDVLPSRQAQV